MQHPHPKRLSVAQSTSIGLMNRVCCRPGDPDAWSEFVDIYGVQVLRWARQSGFQDADAEDVTQEILLRLWRCLSSFAYDPTRSFRDYLRKVAQSMWSDWRTSVSPGAIGEGGSVALGRLNRLTGSDELVASLEAAYNQRLLDQAIIEVKSRVKPRTWEAFRMLAIEQRSGIETAMALEMKLDAVYAARKNVQQMIREVSQRIDGE